MVWWCGCCQLPTDTPFDLTAQLIVEYSRNPEKFAPDKTPTPPTSRRTRHSLVGRSDWFPVWMKRRKWPAPRPRAP